MSTTCIICGHDFVDRNLAEANNWHCHDCGSRAARLELAIEEAERQADATDLGWRTRRPPHVDEQDWEGLDEQRRAWAIDLNGNYSGTPRIVRMMRGESAPSSETFEGVVPF